MIRKHEPNVRLREDFPIFVAILLGLTALFITLNVYPYSYDDAYITYRYSYHFATGAGLVYQPGETHLSTTAPLYALLLGVLALPFPDKIPLIAGWLSGVGLFAGAMAMYIYAHRKGQDLVGILSALPYMFMPMVMDMFGGEVILLTALILWAFFLYDTNRYLLAGMLLGIGAGFRVDALIPVGILCIHYLFKERKIAWRLVLGFAVPYGLWSAYSAIRYGSLLPMTLTAKLAQTQSGAWRPFAQGGMEIVRSFLGSGIVFGPAAEPVFRIYLFLVFLGIIALFLRSQYWLLFLASELLLMLGYSLLQAPFYHWYFMPILVVASILIGVGLGAIPAILIPAVKRLPRFPHSLAYGLIGILALAPILPPMARGAEMAFRRKLAIQHSYPFEPYREIGQWLADNTPRTSTVGYIEIGIIGYYSMREMIDPAGLVTASAIEHVRQDDLAWAYREYLPDYLIINPRFSSLLGPFEQEPWFADCYDIVHAVEQIEIHRRQDMPNQEDLVTLEKAQVQNDQAVGEILPQRSVGQTFIARQNGLRAVALLLATYAREPEGQLVFHLQEVTDGKGSNDLVAMEIDLSEVEDNSWRLFTFPPLGESKGRTYYLYLECPQSQSGEAITAWATSADSYPDGSLFLGHHPEPGDLSFMLYYVRP